jgi:membrane fusion protein (multidrug efflux system)
MPSRLPGLLALVLLAAMSGCAKKVNGPPPPPEAGYVVIAPQAVVLETELAGRTAAVETAEVRPQVTGVILDRHFQEGSVVRQGQTLYEIDASLYRATGAQAEANLAQAQAARAAAEAKADRYKPLVAIEAVSRQEYTDAVAQARQAAAQVRQAEAALQTARINLRFTRVPAPITGRIGRSQATIGALVTNGQAGPLATIHRLDPMFVDIQQSSAEMVALRRQLADGGVAANTAPVRLVLEDGSSYPQAGRLEFSEALVDPSTGAVTLRARFPNPDGLLLPGMFVRAKLAQASVPNAILAPQQAVSRDKAGRPTVLLVGPGNKAIVKTIATDRTIGDKWLVTSGLAPGDRVVVEGLGKIKPGQAVRPVPAGSPPRPPAGGPAK